MLLRRVTEPGIAFDAREILSFVREGSTAEATLVDGYLYEAAECIELVCERAVCMAQYQLVFSEFPSGIDNTLGPQPFSVNYRGHTPGDIRSGYWANGRMGYSSPPAIELRMPPVRKVVSVNYTQPDGTKLDWSTADYQWSAGEPALVYPVPDGSYPAVKNCRNCVTITFWAGETDELEFTVGAIPPFPQFRSLSGYAWEDGDPITLRASGNRNAAFGNVAAVPGEFTENRQYYVVDSDSAGSFNLAATVGGSAIMGTDPVIGSEIQRLYAGRMTGVLSSGLRKIATDSYMNRCSAGTCSCSGKDGNAFMQEPHLRKLMWRPILECA